MKIDFFKKENNLKKKNFTFNPAFYWELAVFIVFVIIILSFFFGYYLFVQINQNPVLPATLGGEQTVTVSSDRLEEVLNYFSAREEKSNQIINSPSPVVDPSL